MDSVFTPSESNIGEGVHVCREMISDRSALSERKFDFDVRKEIRSRKLSRGDDVDTFYPERCTILERYMMQGGKVNRSIYFYEDPSFICLIASRTS